MGIQSPCKGCDERIIGCHGKCEKYKNFSIKNEIMKRRKSKDEKLRQEVYIYERERYRKLDKRKHCGIKTKET